MTLALFPASPGLYLPVFSIWFTHGCLPSPFIDTATYKRSPGPAHSLHLNPLLSTGLKTEPASSWEQVLALCVHYTMMNS